MDIHLKAAGHHVLWMLGTNISPGHVSPLKSRSPGVSVHAEEPCGLWPAVPSLGTSRKIKSGLQEGMKQPHTTFGFLLRGVSGLGQGYLLAMR